MKIKDVLQNKQTLSFEFFPPKEVAHESVLFDTIGELKAYSPDYVSITYGAGGSTRSKTMEWSKRLQQDFVTMMHLTCYGNSSDSIDETCQQMLQAGISNVLALRGDPPKDMADMGKAFDYAAGLVRHIKANFSKLCIGVAGYPETHPQATSAEQDIDNLKAKIDAGAEFIITQLFFDNVHFFRYLDILHKQHINVPVVAGIMPIVSYSQALRFTQMCGATIPTTLLQKIEGASAEDVVKIGEEYSAKQVAELKRQETNGIHYYTLNKSPSIKNILSLL
jgi:methylenetetrahydrofolate reductase (NADPH)